MNFAKTGDPNGAGLPKWPVFETASSGPVLHIGTTIVVGNSLDPAKAKLYRALYERQLASA